MSTLNEKLTAKADRERLCGADYLELDELADEAAALERENALLTEQVLYAAHGDYAGAYLDKVAALEAELASLREDADWVRRERIKLRDKGLALERENERLKTGETIESDSLMARDFQHLEALAKILRLEEQVQEYKILTDGFKRLYDIEVEHNKGLVDHIKKGF